MENLELLNEFQDKIIEIYNSKKLHPLRGEGDNYLIDGKQLLTWHNEVTRHCWIANKGHFDYTSNIDDLLFTSDEIVYFIANSLLFHPYVNNPLEDSFKTEYGVRLFPNYENLYSKRYDMYTAIVFEKVYNYWDRIGDLIASFFPSFPANKVYFSAIMDHLNSEYFENANFAWLYNYKQNEYQKMNSKRVKIVHYHSHNTRFRFEHIESVTIEAEIRRLIDEKMNLPNYFLKLNEECKDGLMHTLKFLEHLNEIRNYPTKQNKY